MEDAAGQKQDLREQAIESAVAVARGFGLDVVEPVVLKDRGNLLIHLKPYPVVARVPTRLGSWRVGGGLDYLTREVAVLTHLTTVGAPALHISPLVPPGPHQHDGLALCFTEWLDQAAHYQPNFYETGRSLHELHQSLASFPGHLERYAAVRQIEGWLPRLEDYEWLDQTQKDFLAATYERLIGQLEGLDLPVQALHGDAHTGNLLNIVGRGLTWLDFEESCSGSVLWDVASLVMTNLVFGDGEEAQEGLAGYGFEATPPELAVFVEARVLLATVWSILLSGEYPQNRMRAVQFLAWLGQ